MKGADSNAENLFSFASLGYSLPLLSALNAMVLLYNVEHIAHINAFVFPLSFFLISMVYDVGLGTNLRNPPAVAARCVSTNKLLKLNLWLLSVVPPCYLIILCSNISEQSFESGVLLIIFTGLLMGQYCIIVAHELIHSRAKSDRLLGGLMLCCVFYPSFKVSHVEVHHKKVATPEDPSSALIGEGVYRFVLRSVLSNGRSAWLYCLHHNQETKIVRKLLQHEMLRWTLVSIGIVSLVYYFFGLIGLVAFFCQALIAIMFLEMINYVQHYGLQRKIGEDGQFEPVSEKHSWNAPYWYSQWTLLNLMRHSDHHVFPRRPYQLLRVHEASPTLPFPISVALLLALFPPLWHLVMRSRIETVTPNTGGANA